MRIDRARRTARLRGHGVHRNGVDAVPGEQSHRGGQQEFPGLGTTFLLPFITCLVVTRLARGMVEKGKLPPLAWRRTDHATLGRLPARPVTRGLVLGLAGLIAFAPVVVWSFAALEVRDLGLWSFVAFKALFAAVLAAIFTPLIAMLALGDASPRA